jgi:hypothetical protein
MAATLALVIGITVLAVLCALLIASSVLLGEQHKQRAAHAAHGDATELVTVMRRAEEVRRSVAAAVARRPYTPSMLAAQTHTHERSHTFPVDAVFTWVDGTDDRWRRAVASARRAAPATATTFHISQRDPFVPSRFRRRKNVRDELFYSAQLVRAYMPWLRQILIVTQRPHVPWWVEAANAADAAASDASDTSHRLPRIVVVHHDEFFGPDAVQPTYNSNVIESQFARLPMLAEHFVSFNDDSFVGRPVPRSMFFTADGAPVLRIREKPAQCVVGAGNVSWAQHLVNMTMVCGTLGMACGMPIHQALPLRKSALAKVVDVLSPVLAQLQPLRGAYDFPVVYVAACATPWVALPDFVRAGLYRSGDAFASDAAESAPPHLFCINDGFDTPRAHATLSRMMAEAYHGAAVV